MIDSNKIITYENKNYLINKFSAYENISFDIEHCYNMYICRFFCKLDFSGSTLLLQQRFIVEPFLNEYEDKLWFGFLPVSFKKRNPVYLFIENHCGLKSQFLLENKNIEDASVLFSGFCSEYIKWIANKLQAQQYLNILLKTFEGIINKVENNGTTN